MASLASTLYSAHRAALADPTSVPAWGNASTEERAAWEAVAACAGEQLAPMPIGRVPKDLTPEQLARMTACAPPAYLTTEFGPVVELTFAPGISHKFDDGDIIEPASGRCSNPRPCGQCATCRADAARDNAARDQPPAFTGTIDELAVRMNALDAADRSGD